METKKIEQGDIVHLKSGGPNMTVEWTDYERNEAYCVWFEKNTNHGEKFAITSLIHA